MCHGYKETGPTMDVDFTGRYGNKWTDWEYTEILSRVDSGKIPSVLHDFQGIIDT